MSYVKVDERDWGICRRLEDILLAAPFQAEFPQHHTTERLATVP